MEKTQKKFVNARIRPVGAASSSSGSDRAAAAASAAPRARLGNVKRALMSCHGGLPRSVRFVGARPRSIDRRCTMRTSVVAWQIWGTGPKQALHVKLCVLILINDSKTKLLRKHSAFGKRLGHSRHASHKALYMCKRERRRISSRRCATIIRGDRAFYLPPLLAASSAFARNSAAPLSPSALTIVASAPSSALSSVAGGPCSTSLPLPITKISS